MKKIIPIILFLLTACSTEPVNMDDDTTVLQELINNSPNLMMTLDTDGSGVIEPLELGEQVWNDNGRITLLNCYNIGLSGGIPESIGKLTHLKILGLKNNNLGGGIPESIGRLTNLTQLSLGYDSLNDSIPESIGNLTKLTYLDLSHNNLVGKIPNSISKLPVLHTLLVDSNNLSGIIPSDICNNYTNFISYDLSGNQFCPPLPGCLDAPSNIGFQNCDTSCGSEKIYLKGYCYSQIDLNVLQTIIDSSLARHPDSLNMIMDVDTSQTIEPLELGFQEWSAGRLEKLDCYQNTVSCNISGALPEAINNLRYLKTLDLQKNNLLGNLPATLGNMSELSSLNISGNLFSGFIPENICNINEIDLENNQFCPCFPECIPISTAQDICSVCDDGYIPICNELNENHDGNNNILELPICFNQSNLEILQAFINNNLTTLDIDFMDIDSSGVIEPLEFGTQSWINGDLQSLKIDNLQLSGGIPDSIGNLTNLITLHLHGNKLSGNIPESICDLTILDWASDSTNGSQSYIFNNQLCQDPTTGWPSCIEEYIGTQNIDSCPAESE